MGAYHGETERGWGVTCLTNPLKTPPRDTVHAHTFEHMQKRTDAADTCCDESGERGCFLPLPPDSLQKT